MSARLAVVPPEDADTYCYCRDGRGLRHVHCPWGGMHIHYVDDDGNGYSPPQGGAGQ